MKTNNKQNTSGFHVVGLILAESIVSLTAITVGVSIGFGIIIVLTLVALFATVYVVANTAPAESAVELPASLLNVPEFVLLIEDSPEEVLPEPVCDVQPQLQSLQLVHS